MEKQDSAYIIINIIGAIYCTIKAGKLNRNQWGWAFFGFCFTPFAVIWILCLKPKPMKLYQPSFVKEQSLSSSYKSGKWLNKNRKIILVTLGIAISVCISLIITQLFF